jgi:hypothetical protein
MKTLVNIEYRKISKWLYIACTVAFFYVSCKDIYDNIKDFAVEEIVYPAKFDTVYATAGFERVEIDLYSAGRVPANKMKFGKAAKTIVEYDTVSIVRDSVCSWINITGLKEPKLYSFKIYTADEYNNRSVPLEVSITPYTSQDRDALGLTPPLIIESTSSALVEWRSRLSSETVFNFYSYAYEYQDRNEDTHAGEGVGDLPSFFVENIRRGEATSIKIKSRIQPVLNGKLILDTIDWIQTLALNISDAAIPALFLKTPSAGDIVQFPLTFEWIMTEEVTDYTLKLSRNSAFLPEETITVNAGNNGVLEMGAVEAMNVFDFFNASVMNIYWTVTPTTPVAGLRTQFRQLTVNSKRDPRSVADMADVIFNPDGTATDISLSSQFCSVNRIQGTNPLDVVFNNEYQRYMACFNPVNATGSNSSVNESSLYQIYYSDNTPFREKLANTHSLEVVVMMDEEFPLTTNNEVKILSSQGGGGTGLQVGNKDSYGNEFVFQISIGGWKYVRSGVTPVKGKYYHLVGVWDKTAGRIAIYIDGEKKNETTQTGDLTLPSNVNTYWFALGGTSGVAGTTPLLNNVMHGNIVLARIHSKALTDEDVDYLYQHK